MFTDLYDIFATDDLNFILHSIKIIEKKINHLLVDACRHIQFDSVQSIALTRAKKKRAKQVFTVHRSTQTKKGFKIDKKIEEHKP